MEIDDGDAIPRTGPLTLLCVRMLPIAFFKVLPPSPSPTPSPSESPSSIHHHPPPAAPPHCRHRLGSLLIALPPHASTLGIIRPCLSRHSSKTLDPGPHTPRSKPLKPKRRRPCRVRCRPCPPASAPTLPRPPQGILLLIPSLPPLPSLPSPPTPTSSYPPRSATPRP